MNLTTSTNKKTARPRASPVIHPAVNYAIVDCNTKSNYETIEDPVREPGTKPMRRDFSYQAFCRHSAERQTTNKSFFHGGFYYA